LKLQTAYATLSDQTKRRAYDLQYASLHATGSQTHSNITTPAGKTKEPADRLKKWARELEEQLEELQGKKERFVLGIHKEWVAIVHIQRALVYLQEDEDKDSIDDKRNNRWFRKVALFAMGKPTQTQEEVEVKRQRQLNRSTIRKTQEDKIEQHLANIEELRSCLGNVIEEIEQTETARSAARRRLREAEEELSRKNEAQKRRVEKANLENRSKKKEVKEKKLQEELQRMMRFVAEEERRHEAYRIKKAAADIKRLQKEEVYKKEEEERARQAVASCNHILTWGQLKVPAECQCCPAPRSRARYQCPGCYFVACTECKAFMRRKAASRSARSDYNTDS
jgi:hypothetical protein